MFRITALILSVFLTSQVCAQESEYQKNLKVATDLFSAKSLLPDSVLRKLAPDTDGDFRLLYGTTDPGNKMQNSGFFEKVTQQIFDKYIVEQKEEFYLPILKLISFADGEFGEHFTDNLEVIIGMDKAKFCASIKGANFANHNPIKFFAEQNQCK